MITIVTNSTPNFTMHRPNIRNYLLSLLSTTIESVFFLAVENLNQIREREGSRVSEVLSSNVIVNYVRSLDLMMY